MLSMLSRAPCGVFAEAAGAQEAILRFSHTMYGSCLLRGLLADSAHNVVARALAEDPIAA